MKGCLIWMLASPLLFIVLGWPWLVVKSVPVLIGWWVIVVALRLAGSRRRLSRIRRHGQSASRQAVVRPGH